MTTSLSVGNLYAAKVDEGWHRVEVLEILSNDTVSSYLSTKLPYESTDKILVILRCDAPSLTMVT